MFCLLLKLFFTDCKAIALPKDIAFNEDGIYLSIDRNIKVRHLIMTSNSPSTFAYTPKAIKRAKIALSCSPFRLKLFQDMRNQSVPISQIAEDTGVELGYAKTGFSESRAEDKLVWLINVGLLRREVDGQGLTDSFRLTPLGRKIVEEWEQSETDIPDPSTGDRLSHWLNRWLKLSL